MVNFASRKQQTIFYMTKPTSLQDYASNLRSLSAEYESGQEMQRIAFVKMLSYFCPCPSEDIENKEFTTEELKKAASTLVTLKTNEITAIMIKAGFDISVNEEMVAAWNIKPLKNPLNL